MSTQPKIGLLPLYLKLYDDAKPEMRERIEGFVVTVSERLGKLGLDVAAAPVCRLRSEFKPAVTDFEQSGCDLIVTLHMAYSPSLESADVLAGTSLPIVMLDTTPTEVFTAQTDSTEIIYNHGIHGVQDLANLFRRLGKPYRVEAGHWETSDVLDRVASWAMAAAGAKRLRTARVGRMGQPFVGMGDFYVEPLKLQSLLGIEAVPTAPGDVAAMMPGADAPEVDEEMALDRELFDASGVGEERHRATTRCCLGLRKFIEANALTAFSMNFCEITADSGLPCVPFIEACKGMMRGLGYAGEGDVLTAALVGALASTYGDTTFTEMFCPNWRDGTVFLSHMGEFNLDLAASKPVLIEKDWPYTDAGNPVSAVCAPRLGPVVVVNIAPGPDDTFGLVVAPGEIIDHGDDSGFAQSMRGWLKPQMPIDRFLEAYSRAGGTHHSAMIMADAAEDVERFAAMAEMDCVMLSD